MLDVVALGELLIDFATVSTDGDGYPTMAANPGADTQLTWEEIDKSLIDEAKVFHFGTLRLSAA